MLLQLRQVGEPILRQKARTVTPEELLSPDIQDLISSMQETLRNAPGVGLAAPQIGVGIQLAIIEDLPEYWRELSESQLRSQERRAVPFHVIANPQIVEASEAIGEFFEGCLSLVGFTAIVPRSLEITVECFDHRGDPQRIHASGWYARILQHEIDHLNGAIYIDRMASRSFMSLENYKRYWKEEIPRPDK